MKVDDFRADRQKMLIYYILIFCSFFSINSLMVNPVYPLGIIAALVSLKYLKISKVNKFQLVLYLYAILTIFGFFVGINNFFNINTNASTLSSILYVYCIILGAQTVSVGLSINSDRRQKVYSYIYTTLICYMLFDLIIRVILSGGDGTFYDFKWGLFYFDSNFSALIILLFLMFSVFLKVNNVYDIGRIRFFLLIILLLTTFSRAAIFSFVVSYLLLRYARKIIGFLSVIFFSISAYVFYRMVSMYISGESFVDIDGSFNSKFYIISVAIDNYYYLPWVNKVFGVGMANFPYFSNGIFAHNMLVTLVYEFGFYGMSSFVLFLIFSYKMIGKNSLYILLPFFIAGFSLFSAFMPFFFVLLACIYVERLNYKGVHNG